MVPFTHSQLLLTAEGLCKLLQIKCMWSAAWGGTDHPGDALPPTATVSLPLAGEGLEGKKATLSFISGKRRKLRGDKTGTVLRHC